MEEIEILIVKLKPSTLPDEFINTELTLKELKNAIHFFEEKKRKNAKGGRPKKVEKWIEKFGNVKHYFLFEELDNAYKNRDIGRDSFYQIHRKLRNLGWDRKFLDQLYDFTLTIRKLLYLIINYKDFKKAKEILKKQDSSYTI